jgi:CRP/FNR family transcriptional regulator
MTAGVQHGACAYCAAHHVGLCQPMADGEGLEALNEAKSATRLIEPDGIIYRQGDAADTVFNLISGWGALHRDLADGRRHIIRFLLPGALFGVEPKGTLHAHGAFAITNVTLCKFPRAGIDGLRHRFEAFNERFIWMLERENHQAIETLTMIGQGTALERVSRVAWELASAISHPLPVAIGAVMKAPLTQRHLADATGLTSIHVNRVLRRLRETRVVEFHKGHMVVLDPDGLRSLANA